MSDGKTISDLADEIKELQHSMESARFFGGCKYHMLSRYREQDREKLRSNYMKYSTCTAYLL